MAAQRCPRCGAFGPAGTAYCAFCGAPFPGASPGSPLPPARPFFPPEGVGGAAGFPVPGTPSTSPESIAAERGAISRVLYASVLLLLSSVLGVGAELTTTAIGTRVHFGTEFELFALLAAAVELAVVALLYLAFRGLAPIDRRFSTPSKLVLLLLVALVLLLALIFPLISAVNTLEACVANSGTNQTAAAGCLSGGSTLALLGGVSLVAIVAFVGFIGLLLGIWRLGTRYGEVMFKVGAVLLIFPFLNLVGGILILLGSRAALPKAGAPATLPGR